MMMALLFSRNTFHLSTSEILEDEISDDVHRSAFPIPSSSFVALRLFIYHHIFHRTRKKKTKKKFVAFVVVLYLAPMYVLRVCVCRRVVALFIDVIIETHEGRANDNEERESEGEKKT